MKRALIILGLVAPMIDKDPPPPIDVETITIENVWFSGQPSGVLVEGSVTRFFPSHDWVPH